MDIKNSPNRVELSIYLIEDYYSLIKQEIEDKIADILIERAEEETSEISVTAVKDEIKVAYKK